MSEIQLFPDPDEPDVVDLAVGSHEFRLPVAGFPFATYGYSVQAAPSSATAATVEIAEAFCSRPTDADWFPVPLDGALANPGQLVTQSQAIYRDRAMVALRFTIQVTEALHGFRLYACLGKRGDLR